MEVMRYSNLSPDLYPGYSLCQFLGNGGFGEVWSAKTAKGEPVALKFLCCGSRRGSLQELRSIQLVLSLSHPLLVEIKNVWAARDYVVVAMELADGSLADVFDLYQTEAGTPLPAEDLVPFLAQAAEALDFLNVPQHTVGGQLLGIQHCDISPGNLLLFDQAVKLSDFSLTTAFSGISKDHVAAGKPAYAAPEVFQRRLSNRTDQYALAASYCVLRSGRLPFPDTPDTFDPNYTRSVPELSVLTSVERKAIERALAVQPQDRWNSCREMVSHLVAGPPEAACRLLLPPGEECGAVKIQAIASDAIRVLVCRPRFAGEPGSPLSFVLANRSRDFLRVARSTITHRVGLPAGDWVVTGKFESKLRAEDLLALRQQAL
jgi:serine/threonine protein kinase